MNEHDDRALTGLRVLDLTDDSGHLAGRILADLIVGRDPQDNPILRAAVACGADYLVSNDWHLRELNP